MAQEPVYNLLQAIDPSKIKIPINEKFSKLTLSSSKKKTQQQVAAAPIEGAGELQQHKRDSASRNLLKQLSEPPEQRSSKSLSSPIHPANPLLCSDSSKDQSHHREKSHLGEYYETAGMDSLNVTEEESDLSSSSHMEPLDVNSLAQKISALSVVCRQAGSMSPAISDDPLNEVTQIVSTESQRSSMGCDVQRFHNFENVAVRIVKRDVITLTVEKQEESLYEITDDEDELEEEENDFNVERNEEKDELEEEQTDFNGQRNEEDEDENEDDDEEETDYEDEVITISDSSHSAAAPEQSEMCVSALRRTSQQDFSESSVRCTEQLPLHVTLSPDKMERVKAFLRDVSMEQRNRLEIGCLETEDSICNYNLAPEEKEQLQKAQRLTKAETESMTPEDDDKEDTPEAVKERRKRLQALEEMTTHKIDDTKSKAMQLAEAETQDNTIQNDSPNYDENTPKNRERRLVSADTVENSRSDIELDSPLSLHVTPTPKKTNTECFKKHDDIHDETEDQNLMPQMSDLNLKSQSPQKTPQTIKRCYETHTDIQYFSPKEQITPKTNKKEKDVKRLASAETVPNTVATDDSYLAYESPTRPESSLGNKSNTQRFLSCEREKNTPIISSPTNSPTTARRGERRLVSADTEDVTLSDLALSELKISDSKSSERRFAHDDTEPNTQLEFSLTPDKHHYDDAALSVPSSPVYKTPTKRQLHGSVHSIVSSEEQYNDSIPEHSVVILETDDEECAKSHSSSSKSPQSNDNNKLSSSFQANNSEDHSSSSSMSQLQMSMANINISAKINIKITIPTSAETSEDEESLPSPPQNIKTNSLPENRQSLRTESENEALQAPEKNSRKGKDVDKAIKPINHSANKKKSNNDSSDVEEIIVESEKSADEEGNFVDAATKLLTQLYGETWQTPAALKSLKKCKDNDGNRKVRTSSKKQTQSKEKDKRMPDKKLDIVQDSTVGDFSMFRRNIFKTNTLDSTRLYTPTAKAPNKVLKNIKECRTEPRNISKEPAKNSNTEKHQKTAQIAKWRQIADSDSECNNASDDDEPNKTDKSWNCSSTEYDSDFVISPENRRTKKNTKRRPLTKDSKTKSEKDDIVYLDLSKEEVEVQQNVPVSPPANHDVTFASKLQEVLKSCRHETKPKLPSSAQSTKSKRKLFTPIFGQDLEADLSGDLLDENNKKEKQKTDLNKNEDDELIIDDAHNPFDSSGRPKKLNLLNKRLEEVKFGKPVFQLTPSPKKPATPSRRALQENINNKTPKSTAKNEEKSKTPAARDSAKELEIITKTPQYKYSFLKSLDATVSNSFCHPDARLYRDSYRTKKEDLTRLLYDLYNEKLFKNKLDVEVTWNKKLLNTAGRCLNKKKLGIRTSVIELSEKVLTSADRLRCTLIHELCHAATWIFNEEGGHGKTWKDWAYRANATFPELPKIGVCHQYDIEYKYTYKCTLCAAKSHAHSKSKKVENIRCSYCHGAIEIFLNKRDKDGNIMPTPVREATGFAKFVKDNYKKYKREDLKHADVMKLLSNEFASMKLTK